MEQIVLSEDQKAEMQRLQKLRELFWTKKLGYYPTKMEKVGRRVTWEQANKEKEQEDLEFQEFLKELDK